MPGMVSSEKLARLAAADGREFDGLFLDYMIRHHRGALTMVRRLTAANGGAEPEIGLFTRHVEADQNIEIDRMQDLLASSRVTRIARRRGGTWRRGRRESGCLAGPLPVVGR